MKKITKLISVLALSSAALLFAGCAKDYSADIQELQDKVAKLESTELGDVTKLKEEVAKIETEIEAIIKDIALVRSERDAADKALQDGKVDKTTYEAKVIELNALINDLQNQLTAKTAELAAAIQAARDYTDQKVATLSASVDTKVSDLYAAIKSGDEATVKQLQSELAAEVEKLKEAIEQVKTDYKAADAQLQQSINTSAETLQQSINSNVKALEEKIAALKEACEKADAALEKQLLAEVATLNTRINSEVATLEAAYKKADADIIKDYTAKFEAVNVRIDSTVAALKDAIIKLKEAQETGDKDLEEKLQSKIDALWQTVNANKQELDGEITKLEAAYKLADEALRTDLNNEIQDRQKAVSDLEAALKQAIKDGDNAVIKEYTEKLSAAITDLEGKIGALKVACENADAEIIKDYTAKIQALQDKLDQAVNDLTTAYKAADDKVVADLEKKISDLKSEITTTINGVINDYKNADNALETRIDGKLAILAGQIRNEISTGDSLLQQQIDAALLSIVGLAAITEYNGQEILKAFQAIAALTQTVQDNDYAVRQRIKEVADSTLNNAKEYVDAAILSATQTLMQEIQNGDAETLETAKTYAETILATAVNAINTRISSLETTEANDYKYLLDKINDVKSDLSTAITDLTAAYKDGDAKTLQDAKDYALAQVALMEGKWRSYTDARIADLRDDVIHYDIELYKKCRHELDSVATKLRDEFTKADEALRAELVAKINKLNKKVDSLDNVLNAEIVKAKLEAIATSAKYTDKQIDSLGKVVDGYVDELRKADKKLADRIEEVKDSLVDVINAEVKKLNERIDDEVKTLNTRIDSLKNADGTRITALEGRCTIIEGTLTNLGARVDSLVAAVNTITSKVGNLETNVSDLLNRMRLAEQDIENNKKAADEAIEALQNRCKALEDANYQKQIDDLDERLKTLETFAWKEFVDKVKALASRIDKIEAAVKSVSVLAPSANNYEIREYQLSSSPKVLANKAAFHAKFQVRPAEAVSYIKANMLKLHVMEGVSRAVLDATTEYDVKLLAGDKESGIIEVASFVPVKEIDANTYYFALAVVDTAAASTTSHTLVMSDYQKAYYDAGAPVDLTRSLRWGEASGTPDAYENLDYSEADWFTYLHQTGRSSKEGKYLDLPDGKPCFKAYVNLYADEYITLEKVNELLGEDLVFVKQNSVSAFDKLGNLVVPVTDVPIQFEQVENADTVNSWLGFRVDTISITASNDVRAVIGYKSVNNATIKLKRKSATPAWATNLSANTAVTLAKHVITDVVDLKAVKGRYWAYNTPNSTVAENDTIAIVKPYLGDTWDNAGFTNEQFETKSTFSWGTKHAGVYTTAATITKDAGTDSQFIVNFGVDQFAENLVDDFANIKVDNGYNVANFKFEVFATGIGNIVYKNTLDNVDIDWLDNSKNYVRDPFLSAANSYYYTTKNAAGDTVGVDKLEIPAYTGRPAMKFSGIDYMFGEKYVPLTDAEKKAYLAAIKTGVDRISTVPDSAHIQAQASWDYSVDESFFAFNFNYFEYNKTYKFKFAKNGIFGSPAVSKFEADYVVNTVKCPFELKRKAAAANYEAGLHGHIDATNYYTVDNVKLQDCYEVVDVQTGLPYKKNNGAIGVEFTSEVTPMEIAGFLYNGHGAGAFDPTTFTTVTDGALEAKAFQWGTYSGRKQNVGAELKYGPAGTYKFGATKDALKLETDLPYDTDNCVFVTIEDAGRTSSANYEVELTDGIQLSGQYYEPECNYVTNVPGSLMAVQLNDEMVWTQTGNIFNAEIDGGASVKYYNTEFTIDWSKRKSTHDGVTYDSPDDKVNLKIDGGKLKLYFDKSLEEGEYIIYLPVTTKYYLNFQNGSECAKEFLNGVVNYAEPTKSTTLTIKVGTPRI